ncbi:MAG: AAA family ATPase [Spirochaetaceae bacterium]|nr:AAA family ATPase [Spirochaetaceae bacterium]MCF7948632.1 AAA family ATPase [Spirochaetia bacterium]MCF7950692.1 AAA family ATPase [Spirochaetaceae bacterium]
MFLKSVELFGFKSFADRSKIEFRDGISALLGPNGCGKSNVVDGVKWVLGEQSTRSLRADRMEDIIFNGTETRKALNVAEVTLTLSNEDGFLSMDMPEIAVKRRLHRSGESEYFINSTPVKLKEVRELFFDTGIGKSAYSIMEQGKIDQILSNKPEERRFLFEEAAGITKYKYRGAEAERKLKRTEENMQQVENILREVKRSYNTLKAQSEKTAKYREYNEKVFSLELDLQLLKLKDLMQKQQEREEQLDERLKERDALKKAIDEINESLEKNLDQVNSMESQLIEGQKKLYGLDIEKNNHENQRSMLSERMEEIRRQNQAAEQREKSINEKMAALKKQAAELQKQLEEYKARLEQIDKNISEFENSIENARGRIEHNRQVISELETANKRIEQEIQGYQKELHTITDDIVAQLDQKLDESGYSSHKRRDAEHAFRQLLQETVIQVQGKNDLIKDMQSTAGKNAADLNEALSKALSAFEEVASKTEQLEQLFDDYHNSIPAFLDEFLAPEGIITRKRSIEQAIDAGRSTQNTNTERLEELKNENTQLGEKIDEYRKTLEELRVNRVQVHTQKKAAGDSLEGLRRQLEEQEGLLEENRKTLKANTARIGEIETQLAKIAEKQTELAAREKELQKNLKSLESGISNHNKDLKSKESSLKKRMDNLGKLQDKVEKLQVDVASLQTEIRSMYSNFQDRHGRELTEFESRMFDITTSVQELKPELQDIRQKLKDLGQVNLMAPEEFAEVKERYDFLSGQLQDLYEAREDLQQITQEIKTESTELFLETYDQIRKNFHSMFRRLFGGGRGELKLSDPDNVLESGIEIFAQPPGKALEHIALLSGGERSLTAVGLLFATYMVKPSPFCILDEIDAALDEGNVGRFINLLMEFGNSSQFVVITHNKKTVAGARTMLGVTMQESGVSKVIAVRLAENGDVVERAGQVGDNNGGDGRSRDEQPLMDLDGEGVEKEDRVDEEIADGLPDSEGN